MQKFENLRAFQRDLLVALRQKPGLSGYDLIAAGIEVSKGRGGNTREMSIGWFYYHMSRLEENGWVSSQMEPGGPERQNREKKCWYLTRPID